MAAGRGEIRQGIAAVFGVDLPFVDQFCQQLFMA
jgi:hypothetical protein